MRKRAGIGLSLLLLGAAAACRRDAGSAAPAADDPRREAVRAFWAKLRAANDARLGSGCAPAVTLYREALALDPRHEDALYYLGQCEREQGRPGAARSAFELLVETNPASARGHLALAALLASPDPGEPMDLAVAEQRLRRAHAINAEETGPMLRLGEVVLVRGRAAEAREWFEAALRTNPKSVEAAFLAGFVAWTAGARDVSGLAERVRRAAAVVAPVKGVLGEGDRRAAAQRAAPPLESPLGRLLFSGPIATLRARAASGQPIGDETVVGLWRETGRLQAEHAKRHEARLGS
jgi:hypothetical protein